jgi:hypothetical protein
METKTKIVEQIFEALTAAPDPVAVSMREMALKIYGEDNKKLIRDMQPTLYRYINHIDPSLVLLKSDDAMMIVDHHLLNSPPEQSPEERLQEVFPGGEEYQLPPKQRRLEELRATQEEISEIIEETEEEADEGELGILYAYTFPLYQKPNGAPYPIKIGITTRSSAEIRIDEQLRHAPEHPVILKTWTTQRVAEVEAIIHRILDRNGKKRNAPYSKEWFDTTLEEIERIINVNSLI